MGLRVNSNIASLFALNSLSLHQRQITISAERISSGLRINRASDDPSGLQIAESLKTESQSLLQAIENAGFAQNLINSADGGLAEIGSLLISLRTDILAALGDPAQVGVLQTTVDATIDSISTIAAGTRFGNRSLLNGQASVVTTGVDAESVSIRRVYFGDASFRSIQASVTARASQATIVGVGNPAVSAPGTNTIVRLQGPLGTEDVTFFSVVTLVNFRSAINAVRDFTGIFFSNNRFVSEDYGSDAFVSVTEVQGQYVGPEGIDYGRDIQGTIGGRAAVGNGLDLSIGGRDLSLTVSFSANAAAGFTDTFTAFDTGLEFQLGTQPTANDLLAFAIESVLPGNLGRPSQTIAGEAVFGFLSSVTGGGANDLATNPGNALRITDEALGEVNSLRGFLGAIASRTLQPTIDSFSGTVLQLIDAEDDIRGADLAAETVGLSRAQILATASTSVLAQVNQLNGNLVSALLGIDVR